MNIYLIILICLALIFDIVNGFSVFKKKKKMVIFLISIIFWYGISISLVVLSVNMPLIQKYNLIINIPMTLYFIVHFYAGLILHNCEEQKRREKC